MRISTQMPDDCDSNRCPTCGKPVRIPPSLNSLEVPCPHCGHLIWVDQSFGRIGGPFGRLWIENKRDVTVVHFVDREILNEQNIQMVGDELFKLVDELGRQKILLNFGNVEFLSSAALGKLITLNRKVQAMRGKLILCSISKEIKDVFEITKLDKLFTIAQDELSAMQCF
jgi:anti-sigma B factor antagonist